MTTETQDAATAAQELFCSFCARPSSEVAKLIAGPGVHICDRCVVKCNDVLEAESRQPAEPKAQPAEPREQLAELRDQLAAWGESLTDEQIIDLLPRVAAVAAQTESTLQRLVGILRARRTTWARIGSALQITRQSAWERFSGEE